MKLKSSIPESFKKNPFSNLQAYYRIGDLQTGDQDGRSRSVMVEKVKADKNEAITQTQIRRTSRYIKSVLFLDHRFDFHIWKKKHRTCNPFRRDIHPCQSPSSKLLRHHYCND